MRIGGCLFWAVHLRRDYSRVSADSNCNNVNFFAFADIDLNSWIRHFEAAQYDPVNLREQHRRVRRSSGGQQKHIYLNFKGHGR